MDQDNLEENDKYDYGKIEKYINGELSDSEQALVHQRLQDDSELKREVDLYKELNNNLAYKFKYKQEDNEFKATIEDLGSQYFPKKSSETNVSSESDVETLVGNKEQSETENPIYESSKRTITKRLLILGAFVAAATVLFFLFNPFKSPLSNDQIIAKQNFIPHEWQTSMSSGNGNNGISGANLEGSNLANSKESNDLYKRGKKFYNAKDYASAKQYLDQYLTINPNNIEVQLAKGSCEFKLDQTDSAIQTFKKLKDNSDAQWYLALAYLKNKEAEKAKPLLQNLSKNIESARLAKQAKEILKEL